MKKYFGLLTETYRKEFTFQFSDKGNVFKDSINTSLKEVLAPFGLTIDPDELITQLKDQI